MHMLGDLLIGDGVFSDLPRPQLTNALSLIGKCNVFIFAQSLIKH